jgi:hypothetical protein
LKEGIYREGNGLQRDLRSREEEDPALTRGSHRSVRIGGRRGYRFGIDRWAAGCNWCWAGRVPPGPFSYFYFFSAFSFSVFFSLL